MIFKKLKQKKMKKFVLLALALATALLITIPAFSQNVNKLSKTEKKEGWELL